ncbi:MAG: ammonia-forming cytochrome c nitrite reductase subunit c552 [Chloroflexi bacterium]|nr:ammonia-forming cytochrome c nitrite reductase subunit c552 [Chloroflexota bacterium]
MSKPIVPWVLVGIIVVLSGALIGTLIFVKNQPPQVRGVPQLVAVAPLEADSAKWGVNFPNQYSTLQKTKDNKIDTTYGGSSKFSWLQRNPRLLILFAGMAFSKEYNDDRGHANALQDVREIKRISETSPGTCYSCKSANNPGLWTKMGMAAYDAAKFSEIGKEITESIGCAAPDKNGAKNYLTFPWSKGTNIDQIEAYYQENGFEDWKYPDAGTSMIKMQHPEYEMFTANSTHYKANVSCADCHMPYTRDGAAKYSTHDVKSPLLNAEVACGACHKDVSYVTGRVAEIQKQVTTTRDSSEIALVDAINAIKAAAANPKADPTLLKDARTLHRRAQMRWDFVAAENSNGFHNPEEALRILASAIDLARQAQLKALQAVAQASN